MFKTKIKFIIICIIIAISILILQNNVFAANENIKIVKESSDSYMIYINDNDNNPLEFAFSNDQQIKLLFHIYQLLKILQIQMQITLHL